MPEVEVAVLGGLLVRDHDEERVPRGQRSRDLLAALVLRHHQPVDPSVLLEQVWGEGAGLGVAVVHTQVARLRRDVGDPTVLTTGGGYRLGELDLDADRFAWLVSEARGAAPDDAVGLLRRALGLWRGDRPYADVSEQLVVAESSRLLGLRTAAFELLAERLLDRGDGAAVDEAAALSERLVAADPLRERGHELAILAAARADALAAYDRLRTTLTEELGIDPAPRAQELQLRVLRDEIGPSAIGSPGSSSVSAPAPTTRIVGREEELARLRELLAERRLVTVAGLGGVGKSRLLAELATILGRGRVGGYLDLATLPERPGAELVEAVGRALGLSVPDADPVEALAAEIGTRATVLLADEAERCLADVAQVVEALLARCPGLRVVVTSRRPLGVAEEAVFALGPLPTPPPDVDPATAAAAPAVVLLRERIADRAPDLVHGDDAVPRLAALARRVDGVPLALQLLAAQAPGRSLDELDAHLDVPLALASDEGGLAPRHRTMQDTVAWSLDRLAARELRMLRRLAVFAGSFEPPVARAVAGSDLGSEADASAALHALVRDALVHVERSPSGLSFRLLRPVRDLARERLAEAGELDAATRRHRRWYAERWRGAQRSDALLQDVREHHPDYLLALAGAHEAGDREQIVDLTATIGYLWIFDNLLGPGVRWCTRALDSGLLSPLERARVLRMRGVLEANHDAERARVDLTEAIPVFAEYDDQVGLSGAHYALSLERSYSGDDEAALEHARLGVSAARHTHDERLADALANLAVVASVIDPVEAEAAAHEAWALVGRSGSVVALSGVATNLAWAQLAMGHGEVALELIGRAEARLAPAEPTDYLRFLRAWGLLVTGEPRPALADLARVIAAHEEAWEGRWMATCFVAAAIGLAAVAHPVAPELLAGAEANWARAGTSPAAWQEPLLAAAREHAAAIGPAPWGADTASGRALAALVLSAV